MTLTTHAIAGAALASLMPEHAALAVATGVVSHFALDIVPHWNYHPRSASLDPSRGGAIHLDRDFAVDMSVIALDGLMGLAAGLFFFGAPGTMLAILGGALGAEAPDALHFAYTRRPRGWLAALEYVHEHIQTEVFDTRPWWGIASQIATAGLIVLLFTWRP